VESNYHLVAAVVDHICAIARRALRTTAALLGVAGFAALVRHSTEGADRVLHRSAQRTLANGFMYGPFGLVYFALVLKFLVTGSMPSDISHLYSSEMRLRDRKACVPIIGRVI
jgi:hypothetical protein